jgi:Cu(I)/Ag(I) efflux system membrane fusion protein
LSRIGSLSLTLAALVAVGAGGYWAGQREFALPFLPWLQAHGFMSPARAVSVTTPGEPIIYYRDPDGLPAYSAEPKTTVAGKEFLPVRASEDISFDARPPADSATAAPVEATKKIRYYRNPMGLPDTSPMPKKDSMGMDYIPVFEGDDQDGTTIKMSPGKLQRTGVRSEPAALRTLTTPVRASGTVQLDEQRQSVIALRFDSYIDRVENITTGSLVHKGQTLMQVYGPDLLSPAAQYLVAFNEHDAGNLKGARRRLENLGVPQSVLTVIEKTREVPPSFAWPSPRDGIVTERAAVEGMKAPAGESLFRLADISVVWVLADIPENDLPSITLGQTVTVKPRGSTQTFEGRVGLIYPTINKETRTARLRVELSNPDGVLLPNMYADVDIATGSDKPVLSVSDTALIDSGDRKIVILDKGDGKFEPRPVKTGRRGGGFIEITDGLADGDQVVVAANFLIDAESNLKAALQGLTPGEAK